MSEEKIIIKGGNKLQGQIEVSGSKNAALPILAATILTDEEIELSNLPHLKDISIMIRILASMGIDINFSGFGDLYSARGQVIKVRAKNLNNTQAEYELVSKMRASIVVLGPLLAKHKKAIVALPGGCAIGARPVNLHLSALEQMGVKIEINEGNIIAVAENGLQGAEINFEKISVGATENIVMAACLANGKTIINNSAIEPEITALIDMLKLMGADITINGRTITIIGKEKLGGTKFKIPADRIEAGSYAVAALATNGEIELTGVNHDILDPIKTSLINCGAIIEETEEGIKIKKNGSAAQEINIVTEPYPYFPTDMQAQFAAFLAIYDKASTITENIFENRFMHVAELNRMGANIAINGNKLNIKPVAQLKGTEVNATDLRASMALVIAALTANGETTISKIHHLDRGYERLEEKLSCCGADIKRI